jgi:hypothetical protein
VPATCESDVRQNTQISVKIFIMRRVQLVAALCVRSLRNHVSVTLIQMPPVHEMCVRERVNSPFFPAVCGARAQRSINSHAAHHDLTQTHIAFSSINTKHNSQLELWVEINIVCYILRKRTAAENKNQFKIKLFLAPDSRALHYMQPSMNYAF